MPSVPDAQFHNKSSRWDQNLLHGTLPIKLKSDQNAWDKSLRLVPGSSLFVGTVNGSSPHNQMEINHIILTVSKTLRAHGVH